MGVDNQWSVCRARVAECAWHTSGLPSGRLATFMGASRAWEFNMNKDEDDNEDDAVNEDEISVDSEEASESS